MSFLGCELPQGPRRLDVLEASKVLKSQVAFRAFRSVCVLSCFKLKGFVKVARRLPAPRSEGLLRVSTVKVASVTVHTYVERYYATTSMTDIIFTTATLQPCSENNEKLAKTLFSLQSHNQPCSVSVVKITFRSNLQYFHYSP